MPSWTPPPPSTLSPLLRSDQPSWPGLPSLARPSQPAPPTQLLALAALLSELAIATDRRDKISPRLLSLALTKASSTLRAEAP